MSRTVMRNSRYAVLAAAVLLFTNRAQAQELPKGADILKKSVAAMGGETALRKRVATHMTGSFEVPAAGITATLEVFTAANPDRMLTVVDVPGLGTIRTGFDGTTAWTINPAMGTQLLTGNQLQQTRQQADPLSVLTPEKYFKSIETVEKTTFAGKDAYKLKLTTNWDESYHEYYDVNTGLQLGSTRSSESQMGPVEVTTTVEDWKEVEGIKVPGTIRQSMMGMEQILRFNNLEFKIADPKVFELPAEIKALVK